MNRKLSPELVCELPVFAASGLVIRNGTFYIISDDEISLLHGTPVDGFKTFSFWTEILPEDPVIRKKFKPDFESLVLKGASLFIIPSFSKKNRTTGVRVDLSQDGISGHQILDLSHVLENLDEKISDINIEGALQINGKLHLFQRGNGKMGTNAVIIAKDLHDPEFQVVHLTLPKAGKIPLTITDATLNENKIWFLAVAEDTDSTYLDGEIVGSYLGVMDMDLKVKELVELDLDSKPEGLAFGSDGSLYLVTDDDSREKPSRLFKLKV